MPDDVENGDAGTDRAGNGADGDAAAKAAGAAAAADAGKKTAVDAGKAGAAAAGAAAGKGKDGKGAASIATGAEATTGAPSDWPDDWRDRMAAEVGGDDKKAVAAERKRLDRFASPNAVWASQRELEGKLGAGGLVKIPGPKATDEEKSTFNKALGVPETPEGYVDSLKLANNRVLGDADVPVLKFFAGRLHPHGATPAQMSALVDAKFDFDQAQAEAREEADDDFQRKSETELRKEWGGGYKANTTAVATLIQEAPAEVRDFFSAGRSSDGRKVGNDPVMLRWLAEVALDKYPAEAHRDASGQPAGDRLAEIRRLTREGKGSPELEAERLAIIENGVAQEKRGRRSSKAA